MMMKVGDCTSFISLGVESKGAQYGNLRLVEIRAPIDETKNNIQARDLSSHGIHVRSFAHK